jgi:hypothetical protein
MHFTHLNLLHFIAIIIVKAMSQSSPLPWEPTKVNPWEGHYSHYPILGLYILQPIISLLVLLDLGSFDNPKGRLAHKQVSISITFCDIELIPTATIAPTAYLRSWALVASIITTRFMVDQCPFLLEALTRVNNNTFLF